MYSVTYNGCVPGMATTDDGSEPMDVDPHPGTTGVGKLYNEFMHYWYFYMPRAITEYAKLNVIADCHTHVNSIQSTKKME